MYKWNPNRKVFIIYGPVGSFVHHKTKKCVFKKDAF